MKLIFKFLALNLIFAICMTCSYTYVYAGKDDIPGLKGQSKPVYDDSFYTEYISQISCASLLKIYRLIKSQNPRFHAARRICRDVEALRNFFCANQPICRNFVIQYVEEHPECKKVFEKNVVKQTFQHEYTENENYKDDPFFKDYLRKFKLKDLRRIVSTDKGIYKLIRSKFGGNLDFALSCPRVLRKFIVENKHILEPIVIMYVQENSEVLCEKEKKEHKVFRKKNKKEPETVLPPTINYVPVPTLQFVPGDSPVLNNPINNTGIMILQTPVAIEPFLKKTVTPVPNNFPPFSTALDDQEPTGFSDPINFLQSFRLAKKD